MKSRNRPFRNLTKTVNELIRTSRRFLILTPQRVWKALYFDSGIAKRVVSLSNWWRRKLHGVQQDVSDLARKTAKSLPKQKLAARTATIRGAASKIQDAAAARIDSATASSEKIDNRLTLPFLKLFWLFTPLVVFCRDWLRSRIYSQLFSATPAIVLVISMAYFLIRIPLNGPDAKLRHYRRATQVALEKNDQETADLLFRKINQIRRRPQEEDLFQSALRLAVQGKSEQAIERMESIANLEAPHFELAHFWLATKKMPQAITDRNEPVLREVQHHLERTLEVQPNSAESAIMLAEVYAHLGDQVNARKIADQHLAVANPRLKIHLAMLYLLFSDLNQCVTLAYEVDDTIKQKYETAIELSDLSRDDYLLWLTAAELQFDFEKMNQILKYALTVFPNDEKLKSIATRVSRIRLHQMAGIDSMKQRVKIANDLLAVEPENKIAVMILQAIALEGDVETSNLAIKALESHSKSSMEALIAMATIATTKNEFVSAVQHFTAIIDQDADNANALNNLAWILSHEAPIDLQKSFSYAKRAVALVPNEPNYRDTKGQILVMLGKWQEAVEELTLALEGLPDNKSTHLAIALAFEKLGQRDLAQTHREIGNPRSK